MKKVLLASTAIAGLIALGTPAQAAQPITVTLGGLVKMEAGLWDSNQAAQMGYELRNESEIYVDTTAEADNGLKYGVHIEIEYAGPGQNADSRALRTDEANIFLSGGFGTVEIGDQDGASDTLAVYAPMSGVGSGLLYGDYVTFAAGDIWSGTNYTNSGNNLADYGLKPEDSSDATKVTYYTPTFAGFKAGITYGAASAVGEGDSVIQTYGAGTAVRRDFIEGGIQYKGEFSGVGILAAFTATNYSNKIARVNSAPNSTATHDFNGFQGGLNISYAGFTLGGGYLDQDIDIDLDGDGNADDSYSGWNIGARYVTGPVAVGVAYQNLEDSTEFSYEAISVGATYTVAPGLAVFTDVTWYDNSETSLVNGVARTRGFANGTNNTGDDGTVFLLGTSVAF